MAAGDLGNAGGDDHVSATPAAGPITATGTASRNVYGQAIALTAFNTVKWWGRLWLPLVFWYAAHFPKSSGTLGKLSFIHFARWSMVRSSRLAGRRRGASACATATSTSRATSIRARRSGEVSLRFWHPALRRRAR